MHRRPGKAGGRQRDSVPGYFVFSGLQSALTRRGALIFGAAVGGSDKEVPENGPFPGRWNRLGVQSLLARKPKRKSWNEGVN